jgi:uncharacterized repeat protein (TIGR03803 family)
VSTKRLRARLCLALVTVALAAPASAEWKEKVLYSFQGGANDGFVPAGGVVFDKQGNLYGATTGGGPASCAPIGSECGTVFQLSPGANGKWTETVIYRFQGEGSQDGSVPNGGLIIDAAGNLYGVTAYGGTGDCFLLGVKAGCGTVYEISPPKQKGGAWTETILYSFPTSRQGYFPNGDLVFDSAGNLYGATAFGGTKGTTCDSFYGGQCGVVFELSPPKQNGGKWTERVLHSFAGISNGHQMGDGANPNGGLALDGKGNVYGTTYIGGYNCPHNSNQGCGTVFELRPPTTKGGQWTERQLHVFTAGSDGGNPAGDLVFDTKGSLYGTAQGGSSSGGGIVYRLRATDGGRWKKTALHWFSNGGPGASLAGLLFDSLGDLYGTTAGGDSEQGGTVFRLRAPVGKRRVWSLDLLYAFTGSPDGARPVARLILGHGSLYSATQLGGTGQTCQGGCGTVYEAAP